VARALQLPQQFLPPPLREHVVSFVLDLAESELVDGHKILPHLPSPHYVTSDEGGAEDTAAYGELAVSCHLPI
jgi:hypothetical protein